MDLFFETPYAELLHQVLMVGGLVVGLAGTLVFYGVGRTRPAGA